MSPIDRAKELESVLGARIRAARKAKGISQQVLGDAVGVSFQQLQKMESSQNRTSAVRLLQICEALKISVDELLGDIASKKANKIGAFDYLPFQKRAADAIGKITNRKRRDAFLALIESIALVE